MRRHQFGRDDRRPSGAEGHTQSDDDAGERPGTTTRSNSAVRLVQPKIWPACNKTGSTPLAPTIVFNKMGKKAPMKTTKIFPASPMPNQRIAIGIHASGEIGRNSSTRG